MKIELTAEEVELIYVALSEKQDRLTHEATDEEYEAYSALMARLNA